MSRKTAYVTGADRGLGLGFVRTLLADDYTVYAGSFMPDWPELQEVKKAHGDQLVILELDVTSDESVESASRAIAADTDDLNLLINNAGNAQDRSGELGEPQYFEDIRRLFEINTFGPLRVTKSVLTLLGKAVPSRIVNVSSVAGSIELLTRKNQIGYTMSKAALNMLTKSMHNNLSEQGTTVIAVHPGWMRSHVFGDIDRMKDAPLEPIDSARAIIEVIERGDSPESKLFVDYSGKPLPW